MRYLKAAVLLILVIGGVSVAFLYSGIYAMGADVPHTRLTYWALETLRDSSIDRVSRELVVPPLTDPELLLAGGPDYNEMCAGCHLRPDKSQSDMSIGLYPRPPNLSLPPYLHTGGDGGERAVRLARRQFWVIKHGIKASGMPAWGLTHDDQRIWAMVAFIQKLPQLTATQYQILTARNDESEAHH